MIDIILASALARLVLLIVLFMLVVGAVVLVSSILSRRAVIRSQLRAIAKSGAAFGTEETLRGRRDDHWGRLADRIERAGLSLSDTNSGALKQKMIAAGFESPSAPRLYILVRMILIIILPLLFVGFTIVGNLELSLFKLYFGGSFFALMGLYGPSLVVQAKIDRRREAIVNGFPDALDLMLVCVESGLGLEAALDRVGRELVFSHPLIAKMLTTTTLQLRAGASRESALRGMAGSAGVEEVGSFTTLLIQSDKLGSSIAATLRVYAAEMREKRRMRAEEKAHRIPVLISIPLVTCMLPVMIGVLMLPAAIRVVRSLLPVMQGG